MPTKPSIAILSIGEMGSGIATLLTTHAYPVFSLLSDRSTTTQARAQAANVQPCTSPDDLIQSTNLILSIVPPRDALATAQRIAQAAKQSHARAKKEIVYIDLNATSPDLSMQIGAVVELAGMKYVDGAIIGGPPALGQDGRTWKKPSIVLSGPVRLSDCFSASDHNHDDDDDDADDNNNNNNNNNTSTTSSSPSPSPSSELSTFLNTRHISPTIGAASALKMCFAGITKASTALCLLSFSTASQAGVLDALQDHLSEYAPALSKVVQNGAVGCQHKAYRWVREMEEIADTYDEVGGWGCGESSWRGNMLRGAAEVFRAMDQETDLGRNKRGRVEEVAEELGSALKKRRVRRNSA